MKKSTRAKAASFTAPALWKKVFNFAIPRTEDRFAAGKILAKRRINAEITRVVLTDALGIPYTTLADMERGKGPAFTDDQITTYLATLQKATATKPQCTH